MIRLAAPYGLGLIFSAIAAAMATAQEKPVVPVPSGQKVILHEVLIDDAPGETWVRFRFVAPQIARQGGDITNDVATGDMDHLCDNVALPYLAEYALTPARIVISLSDRQMPFGAASPDATQYFESYRQEDARCILENF